MRRAEIYYRDMKAGLLTEDENGYLYVVDEFADRVIDINAGKIVSDSAPLEEVDKRVNYKVDKPNKLALKITIILALATFTPTSITVVEIKISSLPFSTSPQETGNSAPTTAWGC